MKSSWTKYVDDWSGLASRFSLILLCFIAIIVGGLAFKHQTMDLRLAFFSIQSLLLVIAVNGIRK